MLKFYPGEIKEIPINVIPTVNEAETELLMTTNLAEGISVEVKEEVVTIAVDKNLENTRGEINFTAEEEGITEQGFSTLDIEIVRPLKTIIKENNSSFVFGTIMEEEIVGEANSRIYGNSGDDTLTAGINGYVFGGSGNDTLKAARNSLLIGGEGTDPLLSIQRYQQL